MIFCSRTKTAALERLESLCPPVSSHSRTSTFVYMQSLPRVICKLTDGQLSILLCILELPAITVPLSRIQSRKRWDFFPSVTSHSRSSTFIYRQTVQRILEGKIANYPDCIPELLVITVHKQIHWFSRNMLVYILELLANCFGSRLHPLIIVHLFIYIHNSLQLQNQCRTQRI